MHTRLVDLAKYIRLYLNLTEGQLTLSQDSFDELTAPYMESYGNRYSWGWGNGVFGGKVVLGHDGSNTLWYASVSIAPEDGYGLIAVSNIATVDTFLEDEDQGDMRGQKAVQETMAMLYEHQTGCPDEGRAQPGGVVLGGSPGSSLDPSPGTGAARAGKAGKLGGPSLQETLRKRTIGVRSPARSSRLRVAR